MPKKTDMTMLTLAIVVTLASVYALWDERARIDVMELVLRTVLTVGVCGTLVWVYLRRVRKQPNRTT